MYSHRNNTSTITWMCLKKIKNLLFFQCLCLRQIQASPQSAYKASHIYSYENDSANYRSWNDQSYHHMILILSCDIIVRADRFFIIAQFDHFGPVFDNVSTFCVSLCYKSFLFLIKHFMEHHQDVRHCRLPDIPWVYHISKAIIVLTKNCGCGNDQNIITSSSIPFGTSNLWAHVVCALVCNCYWDQVTFISHCIVLGFVILLACFVQNGIS